MTEVYIYSDEDYVTTIERTDGRLWPESDGSVDPPSVYLPVHVPQHLLDEYEAARRALKEIRDVIVTLYGYSENNPNYHDEWDAFVASLPPVDDDPWKDET